MDLITTAKTAPSCWQAIHVGCNRDVRLLWKTISERHQQFEWAIEPNLPPQQCPHHVFLLPQKADPRLRVSGNVQIGLADMPLIHAHFLVHDRVFTTGFICTPHHNLVEVDFTSARKRLTSSGKQNRNGAHDMSVDADPRLATDAVSNGSRSAYIRQLQ